MRTQVQRIASRGFAVLRRLRSIRRYMPTSVFRSLVTAFVACWSTCRSTCFNVSSRYRTLRRDSSTDCVAQSTYHRRTAEPTLAACSGTYRVQSCRAHVQGLKRPRAAVHVVGFHPCCRRAVWTPTPLGVHRPVAGAVLPAVNDRTEGVPHRWCTCLERSSL